ncbi:type II toxin-antitoxin system RelE/ParE family toxin [Vibrio cincinnatiensis]|uniref:type II toxin-antitoxin system RelE/ParE family toxin n=1 Tax=Vibrio cincinnatiensis TaxID=675 RepID=UPI0013026A3D|nr:type II toxin-antitoxin system RelE/ParE family toxin [Vibrio cincinnatiensis]
MLDEQQEIDVYETPRFTKALAKLSDLQLKVVEDEIDKLICDPELGEQKKGDLSHLRVHKFRLENQQVLLGYSWLDKKLEIYLLQLGSHENFYRDMKSSRKRDLKLIQ